MVDAVRQRLDTVREKSATDVQAAYEAATVVWKQQAQLRLHQRHWLMYECHECIQELAKHLCIAAAQDSPEAWQHYAESHADHCESLLGCVSFYPQNSHVVAHFEERTAEAIRSLVVEGVPVPTQRREKEKNLARSAGRKLMLLLGAFDDVD